MAGPVGRADRVGVGVGVGTVGDGTVGDVGGIRRGDSSGEASGDDQVTMLLALSARMATDSAFARQLRRKVVAAQ